MEKITRMTFEEWNSLVPLVKDISHELSDSFLLFGQRMRAKIEFGGKKYYASAWQLGKEAYVELRETVE